MKTAYMAPEGFVEELVDELAGAVKSVHGRLVVADGPPMPVAWTQNVWFDPVKIPINSIGEGVRALKGLQKNWTSYSFHLHRRTSLIQDQLPRLKESRLEFLSPLPVFPMGSWTLLEKDLILAAPNCSSPFPNGEARFVEDKTGPPSRAYLKLWELFTVHGIKPGPEERCLDMGSSPGGWTWVLRKLGCEVISVDRAPLDPSVAGLGRITHIRANAFSLKPEDVGQADWFFSDVICYPAKLLEMAHRWLDSGLCKNFVCSVKFKGKTDHSISREFAGIPGSRLMHLFHNKHELTWVCAARRASK